MSRGKAVLVARKFFGPKAGVKRNAGVYMVFANYCELDQTLLGLGDDWEAAFQVAGVDA